MSDNDVPDLPGFVVSEQMQLCLPSRPDWIEAAAEYLRQRAVLSGACEESRSGKLLIALHEAISNAIVHGNLELSSELKEHGDTSFAEALAQRASDPDLAQRIVDIVVHYDGDRCRWIITDQGPGFDFERVLSRQESDDPEVLLASGRGILLMRSFLDEVRYEQGGRRLILTLNRASGQEKRRTPRLPVHEPLRVAPIRSDGTVDWEAAYEAVSRNFSADGVALLQEGLANTQCVLLGIQAKNQLVYVPAEVRHCRTLTGNMIELGCRFRSETEAAPPGATGGPTVPATPDAEALRHVHDVIADLLTRQPSLPREDRRADSRVVFNDRVELHLASSKTPIIGYARDLSKGGIAFIAIRPAPLEAGVLFLPQRQGPKLGVRVQLLRCNKIQDGLYDIGARFVELAT
jgi:anti-sigma regulatory factor (Ser/Thr protein kinase)